MHILCKSGNDWLEWYAISAGTDAAALQAEADRLNLEEYEQNYAEWKKNGPPDCKPFTIEEQRAKGYAGTFFVLDIPDWPAILPI